VNDVAFNFLGGMSKNITAVSYSISLVSALRARRVGREVEQGLGEGEESV
jgi:hypothetical protein